MQSRLPLSPARAAAGLAARLPRHTVRLRLTTLYAGLFLVSGIALLTITNLLARSLPWRNSVVSPYGTRPRGAPVFRPAARDLVAQIAADHATALNQFLAESAIALGIMAVASVVLGWLMAGRVLRPLRQMTAAARTISEDNLHQRLAVPGPDDELKDLREVIDALLARLDAAFTAQRNFVASASHELRTPLTPGLPWPPTAPPARICWTRTTSRNSSSKRCSPWPAASAAWTGASTSTSAALPPAWCAPANRKPPGAG
jgi:signal transduction histidine kinase